MQRRSMSKILIHKWNCHKWDQASGGQELAACGQRCSVYRHQAIPYSNIAYLIDIKCKFRYNSLCEFYDTKVGIGDVVCSFI